MVLYVNCPTPFIWSLNHFVISYQNPICSSDARIHLVSVLLSASGISIDIWYQDQYNSSFHHLEAFSWPQSYITLTGFVSPEALVRVQIPSFSGFFWSLRTIASGYPVHSITARSYKRVSLKFELSSPNMPMYQPVASQMRLG